MNQIADYSTPVVILHSGHHGGLGIARTLGRLGVPVYSVDSTRWEVAFSSRYCRDRFLLDLENEPPERAVAALRYIGHNLPGRPILMPATDRGCLWIAENAEALREVFNFPDQDAALVRTLCDKSRMQELAATHGVPIARSVVPYSKLDVVQFIESAVFPVMVKATDAESLRRRAGGTKFIVHSGRELTELYAKAEDREAPNLMIQEFIPGEDWMFDGYFDAQSNCLFGMTAKKIRRFPAKTGVTSLGICLENDTVFRTTTAFMKAIGYRGILDIGYRRDERDGSYKVLDVNPRIGCTFRLFAASGVDVARALYLDLTGQAVPPARTAEGRKWVVEDFDFFSALRSWREGTLSFKEWARSFAGVEEAACFAWDDPLPLFMMGVFDCCELYHWSRGQNAIRKQSGPAANPVLADSQRRS
jgi:predicted ATP-grasp superfamily ATP-dependent carboligase